MKTLRHLALFLLLFVCAAGFAYGEDLAERRSAPGGGYSFAPPKDWVVSSNAADNSISAKGPSGVNLQVCQITFDGSLEDFQKIAVGAKKAKFTTCEEKSSTSFSTDSGLTGTRLVYEMQVAKNGPTVRQVAFFFDGAPGQKLFIACAGILALGDKYDALFDESIKSLQAGK